MLIYLLYTYNKKHNDVYIYIYIYIYLFIYYIYIYIYIYLFIYRFYDSFMPRDKEFV